MSEERWNKRPGPPCQHCQGPTRWVQRLTHRDLFCEDTECWCEHLPPMRVDEPARGLEGVEIIVRQGRGRLQARKGTQIPGWPREVRKGWFAGADGYIDDVRIVHVACPDGVLRWALMTQLEPDHG